jgi:hypothetical protein
MSSTGQAVRANCFSSSKGPITASVGFAARTSAADGSDVFQRHRADLRQDLLDRQQFAVHELALAQPAHPGSGVLEPKHERPAKLPDAARELLLGDATFGDRGQLAAAYVQHLVDLFRQAASVDAEHAEVCVVGGEGVDGIGKAALLPHLLEEARAHATTQRAVENAEGEPAVVCARDAGHAENEIRLLGRRLMTVTPPGGTSSASPIRGPTGRASIAPWRRPRANASEDEPHDLVVVEVARRRHHGA